MKIILQVISGASSGRKIPMQSGERATFGSSEAADVSLPDADMAAHQFVLESKADGCLLRSLDTSNKVLVNGDPVDNATLNNGDEIRSGHTKLLVRFDGVSKVQNVAETSVIEEPTPSIEELCQLIELDEDGMQLLAPEHTADTFVDTLVAEERYEDAVRLLAYALTKSKAVQWAHQGISEIGKKERTEEDQTALDATGKWIEDSAEENRRRALDSAEELEFSTAPACAAAAAGWSGGSMVKPDLDPIEPDRLLTARMASIAIQIAALEPGDDAVNERYKQVIEMGQALLSPQRALD